MQTSSTTPLTFWQAVYYLLLATFSASGWIRFALERRKIKPEIHKTEAETDLALAQAQKTRIDGNVGAVDALLRMLDRVERSEYNVDEMRDELRECQELVAETELLKVRNHLIETQLERARSELHSCHAEGELRGLLVISLLTLLCQTSSPANPAE